LWLIINNGESQACKKKTSTSKLIRNHGDATPHKFCLSNDSFRRYVRPCVYELSCCVAPNIIRSNNKLRSNCNGLFTEEKSKGAIKFRKKEIQRAASFR
jgi:hypothetical protein